MQKRYDSECSKEKYSPQFRYIKTIFMILTWIGFGIIGEIIGPTIEDLRIYLNSDYNNLSFLISLKNVSHLVVIIFGGILFDKLSNYPDLIMCISTLLLIIPNIMVTLTKSYWLIGSSFVLSGLGNALYDVGGNHIILRLWKGISDSPVNAMHGGYGLGALLAVQIAKPFIQFNPMSIGTNGTVEVTSENTYISSNRSSSLEEKLNMLELKVSVAYWITVSIGILIAFSFFIAQFAEIRNRKKYAKSNRFVKIKLITEPNQIRKASDCEYKLNQDEENLKPNNFFQRILFGERRYSSAATMYMLIQILLITIAMLYFNGYFALIGKYMLIYITMGPSKQSVETYRRLITFYYATFSCSRLLASFVAFKLNTLVFMILLVSLNLVASSFFIVPYFHNFELFYWLVFALKGITSGPCIPSMYMLARYVLRDFNSFVISVFAIGLGAGPLIMQQLAGYTLDKMPSHSEFLGFNDFTSKYFIAYLLFIPSALAFVTILLIILIFKKFGYLIRS